MVQIGIPCDYSYRNSPQRSDYRSERWLQVAMHVGHHDTPATERWYRQVFRRAGQCARFGTRRSETAQNDAAESAGRRHHGNSAERHFSPRSRTACNLGGWQCAARSKPAISHPRRVLGREAVRGQFVDNTLLTQWVEADHRQADCPSPCAFSALRVRIPERHHSN